jgi:hypothetical protein
MNDASLFSPGRSGRLVYLPFILLLIFGSVAQEVSGIQLRVLCDSIPELTLPQPPAPPAVSSPEIPRIPVAPPVPKMLQVPAPPDSGRIPAIKEAPEPPAIPVLPEY